jgi:hypothetical protein
MKPDSARELGVTVLVSLARNWEDNNVKPVTASTTRPEND